MFSFTQQYEQQVHPRATKGSPLVYDFCMEKNLLPNDRKRGGQN